MADLVALGDERYVSVTTYRRDGTPVATPVWVVRDGDGVAVWTSATSGKVKRLRRDPRATVAACDMRGRLRGEPVPARGELLPPAGTDRIRGLIKRKYGFQGWLTITSSLRFRGRDATVGIRLTAAPSS